MFDFYTEAVTAGLDNGVNAGIFIPVADLAGLTQAELTETGTTREGKVIYGILNTLYSALAPIASLGLVGLTKSEPSGTGTNRYTETISLSMQWLINLSSHSVSSVPLPTIGTEAGKGAVSAEDIWPNCALSVADGSISGAGIVVKNSSLADYGGLALTTTADDARQTLAALFAGIIATCTLRTSTVASAITTKTNPLTTRGTGVTIPAAWYDPTNPVTGLTQADIPMVRIFQDSYSLTYELETNPDQQTVEIRVATS